MKSRSEIAAEPFRSASIVLPVIHETYSLLETIEICERHSAADISEYLLILCAKTTPETVRICEDLRSKNPARFVVHYQTLPFLGGAIREAFDLARGSHVVMMASDLETDPKDVEHFVAMAKRHPDWIVTASRWLAGGNFVGYNKLKLVLNFMFQRVFARLFGTRLSDMTYGYRIFPTRLVQSIAWAELRHPFLFETMIVPLRLGVHIHELPSHWSVRTEGESQNTLLQTFAYVKTGLRVRFCRRDALLKRS